MSRISRILERARDSLVDQEKQRWSDERLLRLVDEGHKDLARHSKLLKGFYEFSLDIGEHTYDLPEDVWLLTRATFDDCEISLVSYDQLDEQGRKEGVMDDRHERVRGYSVSYDGYGRVCWDSTTGSTIEYLVYDNRDLQQIRVYPIPDEGVAENDYTFQNSGFLDPVIWEANSPYGVLTAVPTTDALVEELGVTTDADSVVYIITDPNSCNGIELVDDVVFSSPFGLLGEIEDTIKEVGFHGDELLGEVVGIDDYSLTSVFGFTVDLYDPEIETEKFDTPFGVITSVNESNKVIKLWYIRNAKDITSEDDALELPPIFDTALRYYVVGNAFLDDNDAAYAQKAKDALSMYDRELNLAQTTSATDGTRSPTTYRTSYRGPFE